jgi:ATP-dependent helicase HrpA
MHSDHYHLRRDILRFKKSLQGGMTDARAEAAFGRIQQNVQKAIAKKQQRQARRPQPDFNDILPIVARKAEIIETIQNHPVVIIAGETGSGKTTQLPQMCLEAGRGIEGKIGCTQPRRIAALTVARRIAEELHEDIGQSVGHKIRFQDRTDPNAYIKIMTDGILLAETQRDPYLNEYDTIIVDEAHERSLNIDFILGILKNLILKRKHLKLIITSATIDTEKFSKAFDNAPIIEVSGRMFPVEVRYLSPEATGAGNLIENESEAEENSHIDLAVRAVDQLQAQSRQGDILVFMPTEQGIRETCEMIEGRGYSDLHVLPLFARLSAAEQSRIFKPLPGRKIIVATNIAETSITIPGIKYVIDSGLARIAQYSPRTRTTSLPILPVSRSSADQRMGRCGRVENGICLRLYSEEAYENRPYYTPPEIVRANLAEVILRMIALRLGNIEQFPFIDPPNPKSIRDGIDLLLELGAIVPRQKQGKQTAGGYVLTPNGRIMARIPVDPRLSRMLIEARGQGCLPEMIIIVSVLSIQDPRERPAEKAQAADQKHAPFKDPYSDFITLLNIWNTYHDTWRQQKKIARMRKFCRDNFLSYKRMREWRDIHAQITSELEESGLLKDTNISREATALPPSDDPSQIYSPLYTAIHKSVLSGFLSNIAMQVEKNRFKATKGREVMIFPGSGIFNKAASWVVAAEMVETSQLFARTVANIDNAWLEDIGKSLCKTSCFDPHWEKKKGAVVAFEQITLFGLVIVPRRKILYGRIHPEEASEIFIRDALVQQEVARPFPFLEHNRQLMENIRNMEDKIRKRDVLIGDEEVYQFYRDRLDTIYDIRTLAKFIKDRKSDDFLKMTREDLLKYLPEEEELDLYPDQIELGQQPFACDYRFIPGHREDGVTVSIPAAVASSIPSESLEWLVPGLLREKITELIKGLPKEYRKQLVPIASTVDIVLKEMPHSERSLLSQLGDFIFKRFGLQIPARAWKTADLPEHLKMRVAITGPDGKELTSGRDPSVLRQHGVGSLKIDGFKAARKKFERTGITCWDFGPLDNEMEIEAGPGTKWHVYPALVNEEKGAENGIALRLFKDRRQAVKAHRKGVAALYRLHFSKLLKALKKELKLPAKMKEIANYFGGAKAFENQIQQRIVRDLFYQDIRSKTDFLNHAERISDVLFNEGRQRLDKSLRILTAYHETRSTIFQKESSIRQTPVSEQFFNGLRADLERLVPQNFMMLYDSERLRQLERYLQAIAIRSRRGFDDLEKDRKKAANVMTYTNKLQQLMAELTEDTSNAKRTAVEEFFWMIEEYKVSIFAQELKTPVRISTKLLGKQLQEIRRMV